MSASADNSSDSDNSDDDLSSSASRSVFLVLFLIVGTLGNFIFIITVCCHRKHLRSPVFIFSANLAFINCMNCLCNMPITLVSTVKGAWRMSDAVCRVNAFFMNLVIIEMLLTITFMSLDRMMATKHADKYGQIQSIPRTVIMIIYSWVQSLAFSLPILFEAIPVKVYPDIYICIISEETSIAYTCVLILGCFLIPLFITTTFFILILKTSCTERAAVQNILTQHQYSKDIDEPNIVKELKSAKFSAILFISWLLMEVPFVICLLARVLGKSNDLNMEPSTKLNYSGLVDIILLWIKFGYVMVLPISILLWKKEMWQNFKDLILCRKSNLIVDMTSSKEDVKQGVKQERTKRKTNDEKKTTKDEKSKEAFVTSSGFQIPVLFATSHGVHIQTFGSDELSDSEIMYDDAGIRGKKCDVLGSQGNLQNVGDDTSDYDSSCEIDPFSVSHPVSSRSIKDTEINTIQRRSNSQPEVRGCNSASKRKSELQSTSVTTTSAVDSGLDISSGKTITNSKLKQALQEIAAANTVIKGKHKGYSELAETSSAEGEVSNGGDKNLKEENVISAQLNYDTQTMKDAPTIETAAELHKTVNDQDENHTSKTSFSVKCKSSDAQADKVEKNPSHSDLPSPKLKRRKKKNERMNQQENSAAISTGDCSSVSPIRPPPRLKPLNREADQGTGSKHTLTVGKKYMRDEERGDGLLKTKLSDLTLKQKSDMNTQCTNDSVSSTQQNGDVTTPSACKLMDLSADFRAAAKKRKDLSPSGEEMDAGEHP